MAIAFAVAASPTLLADRRRGWVRGAARAALSPPPCARALPRPSGAGAPRAALPSPPWRSPAGGGGPGVAVRVDVSVPPPPPPPPLAAGAPPAGTPAAVAAAAAARFRAAPPPAQAAAALLAAAVVLRLAARVSRLTRARVYLARSARRRDEAGNVVGALAVAGEAGELKKDIGDFYDERSAAWESVWGEHMHHGLYDTPATADDDYAAQVETMRRLLRAGGVDTLPAGAAILDVGCGIGGASRFLANRFRGVTVQGVTLSPAQAARAAEITRLFGQSDSVTTSVADALALPYPDDSFDLVWSLESAEHMPNKPALLAELGRVLKPGGRLLMLAWCERETAAPAAGGDGAPAAPLSLDERYVLARIRDEYCLPRLAAPSEYVAAAAAAGLSVSTTDDWTEAAAPFWGRVARSAWRSPAGWAALRRGGLRLARSAVAVKYVQEGIRRGAFRLAVMVATKPGGGWGTARPQGQPRWALPARRHSE